MSYRWLLFSLTLAALGWPVGLVAQAATPTETVTNDSALITVDALPLQAEVRLDGVLVGTAHDLLGRTVPVLPGDHVVQISAEGHLTGLVQVVTIPNWATRVEVQLVPDRRP